MVTTYSWSARQCHSRVQGIGAEGSAWQSGSQPGSCGQTDKVYMHHYPAIEKMKLSFAALRTEVEVTVSSVETQVTKDKFHMW